MSRSVFVHGALLAASLVAAYLVWTREPTTTTDSVPIVNWRKLDRMIYASAELKVDAIRKRDDQGDYYWVDLHKATTVPKPVASKSGDVEANKPSSPDGKQWKKRPFKGNQTTFELAQTLKGLSAVRALGQLGQQKLEEFGLIAGRTTLTLINGSSKRVFSIGAQTYGNKDLYIKDADDGKVYVIAQQPLQTLKLAEHRLFDRRMHDFQFNEVDRVTVATGGKTKTVYQHDRHKPTTAYWGDTDAPGPKGRNNTYRTWITMLKRLTVQRFDPSAQPPEKIADGLTLEFFAGTKQLGFTKLWSKFQIAPNTVATMPSGAKEFFAITEHTRTPVYLNKTIADGLLRGAAELVKNQAK